MGHAKGEALHHSVELSECLCLLGVDMILNEWTFLFPAFLGFPSFK